jgi:lipopolysaccharide/colanic/teichoic acid biosynthesis glycosyltransferase
VKIFPALLDHRPAYLRGQGDAGSLLLAPMASGTLLCELHARFEPFCREPFAVVPTFEPSTAYVHAVKSTCRLVSEVTPVAEHVGGFASYDLKDWLLIVDPSCFPVDPLDWTAIQAELERHHHQGAMHMVALDANPGGTTERVQVDRHGKVHRIQRYYDAHTWAFARGIACSFVPASALIAAGCTEFTSLRGLREQLTRQGIPSRDVPLESTTIDLESERSLLWLSERCILASGSTGTNAASDAVINPAARLIGPVVVQSGAVIEAGAQIVGPAVIGANAMVGRNAIVAQCLVTAGARVSRDAVIRHRAVTGKAGTMPVDDGIAGPDLSPEAPQQPDAPRRASWYPRVKLVFDVCAAAVSLVVLSPLFALIAVLIKLESRGPVLYGDYRETIGGRVFRCWKFRTMYQGADLQQRELLRKNELDGPQFKMRKDPRITRLGRLLRECSLDELPQLINVVRGEMSLVGPRPSPFRENQICVPWREGRLSVRAGITGLWQVCRSERRAGDFHQWIVYDLLYVQHMSPLVDLRIALATVLTLGGWGRMPVSWVLRAKANTRPGGTEGADSAVYDSVRA